MASFLRRAGTTLLPRHSSTLLSRTVIAPAARHFTASTSWHTAEPASAESKSSQDFIGSTASHNAKGTPEAILKKALTLVPEHGWTTASIAKAAESMGYPAIIHGMFPKGGADLIDYFLQDCLNRLPLELEGRMEGLGTKEKIKLGTLTRLGMIAPYIDQWPEALAIMGQPSNVPMSLNHLARIVDEIWHLAGDKSADMNWYTKRASLAAVYTTTELYMTTDKTPNYEATQRFLDRRFEDAATVGKATNEMLQIAEFGAKSVFGILNSKGFRL
ncbi:COQ9-domain-containing protein [Gamsiella multidivaricata]|uniref:COQ9-domain-containing protein n=1 Tax=Gamsiella multidivaricata TaxID=101098 RepID=UPI0022208BC3|nr:COQ9-domain-containing protein [Gamsiella multidivaricata]KAG0365629.1 Ubiquinone biosynthesis protein coq9, mitochondrial [Gamsiella multidivaricata]KAI7828786.1 COQ9-domain-containing protein [Gamsiella multidivaricata]